MDVGQTIEKLLQRETASVKEEVAIMPEVVSNSLLVSAVPPLFDEVLRLVEPLDIKPALVMVRVVIAEVQTSDEAGETTMGPGENKLCKSARSFNRDPEEAAVESPGPDQNPGRQLPAASALGKA